MGEINTQDRAYFQIGWKINRLILQRLEYRELLQEIVDVLFKELEAQKMGYLLVTCGYWIGRRMPCDGWQYRRPRVETD